MLAQFGSPYHMVLLTAGYLHTVFHEPEIIPKFLELNHQFYEKGKRAKFLPGFRYDDHWKTDLNEVRSMLSIDAT